VSMHRAYNSICTTPNAIRDSTPGVSAAAFGPPPGHNEEWPLIGASLRRGYRTGCRCSPRRRSRHPRSVLCPRRARVTEGAVASMCDKAAGQGRRFAGTPSPVFARSGSFEGYPDQRHAPRLSRPSLDQRRLEGVIK
jgi:hypothetical protein